MGEKQLIILVAAFFGASLVWIVFFMIWLLDRKLIKDKREGIPVAVFKVTSEWRYIGLMMAILSTGLIAFMAFAIPEENINSGDWLISLFLGVFMVGMGSLSGFILFSCRIECHDAGVVALSIFGTSRFMAWSDVEQVRVSGAMQSYKLMGVKGSIYIPINIENHNALLSFFRKHEIELDPSLDLQEEPSRVGEEAHYNGLNNAALYILIGSALAVVFSLVFQPLMMAPTALAILSGFALGFYPAFRNVYPKHSVLSGSVIQFFGTVAFAVLNNHAYYQSGIEEAGVSGYVFLAFFLQMLGLAFLSCSLLLLYSRRFSH